jgi:antitoxin VapB
MPLHIDNLEIEDVIRELAMATGETITTAVRRAVEERLQHIRRERAGSRLAAQIMEIGRRCAALPDYDQRSADEIIGSDDRGLAS